MLGPSAAGHHATLYMARQKQPAATHECTDADMFNVALSGSSVLFTTGPSVPTLHVAFKVPEQDFAAIVTRLERQGVAFGNDPEAPTNGATDDPLGGKGRVYFRSPDGHFLEVTI